MEGSQYVNDFIICCQKLEAKAEGYTPATKRQRFLDQILDDEYDVAKQQLQGDTSKTFENCVERVRLRKQELLKEGRETVNKARRFKRKNGE